VTLTEGIHANVPIAEYVRDPAPEPSFSTRSACALLEQCPARAWFEHPRLNPEWAPDDATKETDIGSIAHDLFLEGTRSRLVVVEADDWRTKAAREQRDLARASGNIPILARKVAEIDAMVRAADKAMYECEIDLGARSAFDAERTLVWHSSGVWIRSRPDLLAKDNTIVVEYKTTGTIAEPNAFTNQIVSMGYDLQAALIRAGMFKLKGVTPDVVFMVQETEPPYLCSFVGLDPDFAEMCDRKLEVAVQRWQQCITSNKWPGYPRRVAWVNPPGWARAQAEMLT
jgi:PDDEXK-like uncharacterized protein DUF3799